MALMIEARRRLLARGRSSTLTVLPGIALLVDTLTIGASVALAAVARKSLPVFTGPADLSAHLAVVGPLMLFAWLLLLAVMGSYRVRDLGAGTQEYTHVLHASLLTAGLTGIGCYVARFDLSRGFFVLTFFLGLPLLILNRLLLRRALHKARRRGHFLQRVLISGRADHVDEVARVLQRERWLGYEIVGALTPPANLDEETPSGIPVLGNTKDLVKYSTTGEVDAVFLADGALTSSAQMRHIVWDLEHEGVQVVVAPSVANVSRERVRIRPVGGLPLVHIDPPSAAQATRWGKRTFDLAGALALLVICAPVFLWAALHVKLHDSGPVFFRQTRIGRNGREFLCLKFRSMVPDAEDRLPDLHQHTGHTTGLFKMKDDPRVTRPGRWLRRYSLDELPQLINVLRGEMSLVGPRPPLPSEVAHYTTDTRRRLRVRPGITGLWQVSGRSDLSWPEAVRHDLYYVDNWSMLQDLNILAKTVGAVLRSRGAY
jgi:exopolysaccharide biosynthesis polyprenyl glycosylphosphotransferase